MDERPPAKVGDTGSIPDLGRSHVLRSNSAREPQGPKALLHNQRSGRSCNRVAPALFSERAVSSNTPAQWFWGGWRGARNKNVSVKL